MSIFIVFVLMFDEHKMSKGCASCARTRFVGFRQYFGSEIGHRQIHRYVKSVGYMGAHASTSLPMVMFNQRARADDFCSIFHRFDVNACQRIVFRSRSTFISGASGFFFFFACARNARIIFVNWNLCTAHHRCLTVVGARVIKSRNVFWNFQP